jgi:hypothetical protein
MKRLYATSDAGVDARRVSAQQRQEKTMALGSGESGEDIVSGRVNHLYRSSSPL